MASSSRITLSRWSGIRGVLSIIRKMHPGSSLLSIRPSYIHTGPSLKDFIAKSSTTPLSNTPTTKPLLGLDASDLNPILTPLIQNPKHVNFRTTQLLHSIYSQGHQSLESIQILPKYIRHGLLDLGYDIGYSKITKQWISELDKTRKLLVSSNANPKDLVETVFIPDSERGTVCVSSQIGCSLSCSFCYTGISAFKRNLTPSEILSQVMLLKHLLSDFHPDPSKKLISNIVFMGSGEPTYNLKNVFKTIQILKSQLHFSARKIVVSTSGVVPAIKTLSDANIALAISLHAATDSLRNELVPINKTFPIDTLLSSCRDYMIRSKQKRITFEYVMLKDVNDSITEARKLVELLRYYFNDSNHGTSLKWVHVNLIPFNPWPGSEYVCSEMGQILKFQSVVKRAGMDCTVRIPRGKDILAACGQLKSSDELKKRKLRVGE